MIFDFLIKSVVRKDSHARTHSLLAYRLTDLLHRLITGLAVLQGIETLARYFDRPILTNNPLLSDSDRSEYRLRFAGVDMLGMCVI